MPSEKLLQLLEHTTTGGKACDMMSLSLMYRLLQGLESFGTFYWLHLEWRDSVKEKTLFTIVLVMVETREFVFGKNKPISPCLDNRF
jgi:hypothetical protein